jgi:hypothetical protein
VRTKQKKKELFTWKTRTGLCRLDWILNVLNIKKKFAAWKTKTGCCKLAWRRFPSLKKNAKLSSLIYKASALKVAVR